MTCATCYAPLRQAGHLRNTRGDTTCSLTCAERYDTDAASLGREPAPWTWTRRARACA